MAERPTKSEAQSAMGRLRYYLGRRTVGTSTGGQRFASADEFMLMGKTEGGFHTIFQFKHRTTRNYVFIEGETLIVPRTDKPYMRGFFDEV